MIIYVVFDGQQLYQKSSRVTGIYKRGPLWSLDHSEFHSDLPPTLISASPLSRPTPLSHTIFFFVSFRYVYIGANACTDTHSLCRRRGSDGPCQCRHPLVRGSCLQNERPWHSVLAVQLGCQRRWGQDHQPRGLLLHHLPGLHPDAVVHIISMYLGCRALCMHSGIPLTGASSEAKLNFCTCASESMCVCKCHFSSLLIVCVSCALLSPDTHTTESMMLKSAVLTCTHAHDHTPLFTVHRERPSCCTQTPLSTHKRYM